MGVGKHCSLFLILCLVPLCMIIEASAGGYGHEPEPNPNRNSDTSKKTLMPGVFSVQGVVYCKSASAVVPLKGGVVRITCLGLDKYGMEMAPFSILSRPTDGNGYFLVKLSSELLKAEGVKVSECKAFLHSSGLKSCPYATDFSRGLRGAPLSAYRKLGSGDMRLYSVGPFVYSSSPQQATPSHY